MFDVLAYADRPLVTAEHMEELRQFWQKQQELGKSYQLWSLDELLDKEAV